VARVLIAHEQALLAESIAGAVRESGHEVSVDAAATTESVGKAAMEVVPDVTLVGIELRRGAADGLRLLRRLKAMGSAVIVFTASNAVTLQGACLQAGADGFVVETDHLGTLLSMVERAVQGLSLMSDRARTDIHVEALARARSTERARAPFARLSRREKEVLLAIIHGRTAQDIAAEAFVSIATVRSHIRTILVKLSVSSQLAAVAAATDAGWPDARGGASADLRAYGPAVMAR